MNIAELDIDTINEVKAAFNTEFAADRFSGMDVEPWEDPFLDRSRMSFLRGYLAAKKSEISAPVMAGTHYEYVQFGEPNEAGDVGLMPVLVPDGFTVVRVPEETPE